jgi:hypothetical protein
MTSVAAVEIVADAVASCGGFGIVSCRGSTAWWGRRGGRAFLHPVSVLVHEVHAGEFVRGNGTVGHLSDVMLDGEHEGAVLTGRDVGLLVDDAAEPGVLVALALALRLEGGPEVGRDLLGGSVGQRHRGEEAGG